MDGIIEKVVFAGPGGVVHADDMQQRRFPRSGRPHDGDEFPFFHFEVHPAEHKCLCRAMLEVFLDVLKTDHGRFYGKELGYSFSRSSLLTAAGSAWPRVAFITWPTKNASTVVLPARYCSCCLGLAAMASSTIFASAFSSLMDCSPSRFMIASGASPEANIFGRISLASLLLILFSAIKAINCPRCSALTGDSEISLPSAFSKPARSPITQLAAARGSPASLATRSK